MEEKPVDMTYHSYRTRSSKPSMCFWPECHLVVAKFYDVCCLFKEKNYMTFDVPRHKQSHVLIGYGQFSRHIRMKRVHNNKVFRSKLTSPLYC